jgi:hypothetical protein
MSRQEHFSFLEFPSGGWDSEVDIIFHKLLEQNAIYGENF